MNMAIVLPGLDSLEVSAVRARDRFSGGISFVNAPKVFFSDENGEPPFIMRGDPEAFYAQMGLGLGGILDHFLRGMLLKPITKIAVEQLRYSLNQAMYHFLCSAVSRGHIEPNRRYSGDPYNAGEWKVVHDLSAPNTLTVSFERAQKKLDARF
jgi:hypothetical protein